MNELITDTNRSPASAHTQEDVKNQQIECSRSARANGVNKPGIVHWEWPYSAR
jgi:phosphoketolase